MFEDKTQIAIFIAFCALSSCFLFNFLSIEKYIFTIKMIFQSIKIKNKSKHRIIIKCIYTIYSFILSMAIIFIVNNNEGLVLFKRYPSNLNTLMVTLTLVTVLAINIGFLSFLQHHKKYSKGVNIVEFLSLAYFSDKVESSKFFLVHFSIFVISSIMYCIHFTWENIYIYFFATWQILFIIILLIICLNIITDFDFMLVINRVDDPNYKSQYNEEINNVFKYYYYYLMKKDIKYRNNDKFTEYFNNQLNNSRILNNNVHKQKKHKINRIILFSLVLVAIRSLNDLVLNKLSGHEYHKNTNYYKHVRLLIDYIISKISMYHYCVESNPYKLFLVYMNIIDNLYSYNTKIFNKIFVYNNSYKYLTPVHVLGLYWNYYDWDRTNRDIIKILNRHNKLKWIPFRQKKVIRNSNLRNKIYPILFRKEFEFLREVTKLTPYKERNTKYKNVYKIKYRTELFKQMKLIDKSLLNEYEKKFNIYE